MSKDNLPIIEKYFDGKTYKEILNPENQAKSEYVKSIIEHIEKTMKDYAKQITYTQIRNILQLVKNDDFKSNIASFYRTIPKLAYIEARPQKKAEGKFIITFIRELAGEVETSEEYKSFIDIMDTIVAYHKLNG